MLVIMILLLYRFAAFLSIIADPCAKEILRAFRPASMMLDFAVLRCYNRSRVVGAPALVGSGSEAGASLGFLCTDARHGLRGNEAPKDELGESLANMKTR